MATKLVSIIIPSYNSRETIVRALTALREQCTDSPYETIVVVSSSDGTAEIVAQKFPEVKLICSNKRLYPGAARNLGIASASGNIFAFTDADCVAAPGWVEAIVQAHKSDEAVIGGIVDNANPENSVGWGYYFTEFNNWSPGAPEGHMSEIPTCCLSMKRGAFERWGPFQEEGYCSDSLFHWRRARDGELPFLDPKIRVGHINPGGLFHMLEHEAFHGKYFARVRAQFEKLSKGRLLLNVISAPLLPFLLFARAGAKVFSRGVYRRVFIRTSLQAFGGIVFWCAGEFSGYLSCLMSPAPSPDKSAEAGVAGDPEG